MFGPSDQDIQAITTWLQSHGFEVANVSPGRHVIEFSGTASQVQEAFHTRIHHYSVNGEEHWANSSDPQIPAALAPVVVGVKSLHDFRAKPTSHYTGLYRRNKGTGVTTQISGPQFTFTGVNGTQFGLGPTDFATIYNVLPLWNTGIDGRGETIAIIQESNINVADVHNFRALFNLPVNDPEIVLDGADPGIAPGIEPEAVIDVTWSGAVAKNAKIKRADVAGRSGFGTATGSVILTDDGSGVPGNPFKLNPERNTLTPNSINTLSVGTHTIRATYTGDLSFLPNVAKPMSFVITRGVTSVTLTASPATAAVGASVALTATVGTSSFGNPPTGKVTFTAGGKKLGTVAVTGNNNPNSGLASATATILTTSLPAGADAITATYSGDQNYDGAAAAISVTITTP
jgi:Pro-kumamolisin, activation domain/Bacterial Ig-like domain (group 3)